MKKIKRIALPIEESSNDRRTGGRSYTRVFKDKPSKYKGVVFYKDRRPAWAMRVYYNGQTVTLNGFETDIEAAIAYNYAIGCLFKRKPCNDVPGDFKKHILYTALQEKLKLIKN